jgi:hypothetical protein
MEIQSALTIIKTYPFADIDNEQGTIRRHVSTTDLTAELLRSYISAYKKITLVPKRMMGTSPQRLISEVIKVDVPALQPVNGLNGFDTPQSMGANSGQNSELYRIMYENAKDEAKEYKQKYEEAIKEKHKAEIELAGNKNSVVGDIAQGLAGFAPMLMGGIGKTAVGVGEAPQQATPHNGNLKPISDIKLQAIIRYYSNLDDVSKQRIYDLLAKVFTDLSLIDKILI